MDIGTLARVVELLRDGAASHTRRRGHDATAAAAAAAENMTATTSNCFNVQAEEEEEEEEEEEVEQGQHFIMQGLGDSQVEEKILTAATTFFASETAANTGNKRAEVHEIHLTLDEFMSLYSHISALSAAERDLGSIS
jgi:hypothetical protein